MQKNARNRRSGAPAPRRAHDMWEMCESALEETCAGARVLRETTLKHSRRRAALRASSVLIFRYSRSVFLKKQIIALTFFFKHIQK